MLSARSQAALGVLTDGILLLVCVRPLALHMQVCLCGIAGSVWQRRLDGLVGRLFRGPRVLCWLTIALSWAAATVICL